MKLTFIMAILRNGIKAKRSSAINICGLSIGFAVLLAIVFFIREELNYNMFHKKIDHIYCVFTKDHNTRDSLGSDESSPALAEALRTEYPEVQDAALFYGSTLRMLVNCNGKKFYEQVQLADPDLFHIFSFPFIKGTIPEDRNQTKIVALSRRLAGKYFGKEDPVGKSFKIDNRDLFTVVAVFENIPSNSSVRFDLWMPVKMLEEYENENYLKTWYNLSFNCYALLNDHTSVDALNKKLYNRVQQVIPNSTERSQLYPFKDVYLKVWNHRSGIRMMLLIAFVILSLVCINFINLQTAGAFERIKNFGLKKINGANNLSIIKQLVVEAFIFCMVSLVIAIILIQIGGKYVFDLLGKPDTSASVISSYSLFFAVSVAFLIAFLSGLVPGLIIKSISPFHAMNNNVKERVSVKNLRVIFTALQFCMAIVLVICLLVTNKQLIYMRNKDLGFKKDQIVYIHIEGKLKDKRELLREELVKNPSITSATLASRSPIGIYWNGGGWNWEGKAADFNPQITYIETDEHFRETFEIEMLEGDYFESETPGVVINETFAKMIAPNDKALNKMLVQAEDDIEVAVTGVIKDIHFKPLNRSIGALMMIPPLGYDDMKYIFLKISPENMNKTLSYIEKIVTNLNPDFPFEYFFLDEDFGKLYNDQERLRDQMMFFSIMAILISCMGLFGILIFMVKHRTKEIGIRKVNGARVSEILAMLNKDFVKWVVIAFVVATPIAWFAMHRWLESFAYKTELSWWIFALAGLLALGIALATVSWQSWKAATRNPVEALRYE